jgi:hypothetical protein
MVAILLLFTVERFCFGYIHQFIDAMELVGLLLDERLIIARLVKLRDLFKALLFCDLETFKDQCEVGIGKVGEVFHGFGVCAWGGRW